MRGSPKIQGGSLAHARIILEVAESAVARAAEEAADRTRTVVVVNGWFDQLLLTDRATPVLGKNTCVERSPVHPVRPTTVTLGAVSLAPSVGFVHAVAASSSAWCEPQEGLHDPASDAALHVVVPPTPLRR